VPSAKPILDELTVAVNGFGFLSVKRTDGRGSGEEAETADKATTGIEPVYTALQAAA
jgi:hypothetical protein